MENFQSVKYHVMSSIRAAMIDSHGYTEESDRLRSQAKLRLMVMSDGELWELAKILSFLPGRPIETVYNEIKQSIEEHKNNADDWIGSFGVETSGVKSA